MNISRLRKLEQFLRELDPPKFDFSHFVTAHDENNCGTICCAIGWLPAVDPESWRWINAFGVVHPICIRAGVREDVANERVQAETYFDLSNEEITMLFYPSPYEVYPGMRVLDDEATPIEVANNINAFIAFKLGKVGLSPTTESP